MVSPTLQSPLAIDVFTGRFRCVFVTSPRCAVTGRTRARNREAVCTYRRMEGNSRVAYRQSAGQFVHRHLLSQAASADPSGSTPESLRGWFAWFSLFPQRWQRFFLLRPSRRSAIAILPIHTRVSTRAVSICSFKSSVARFDTVIIPG